MMGLTEKQREQCGDIPVARPYIWGNELSYVQRAIQSGWISSRGEFVEKFEQQFAALLGRRFGVSVCNGTAAVHLALVSLGITRGDEVIVPNFCMISPILAVLYCQATPVPVDVDETWNLNPSLIAAKVTRNTKAILVVHNYGHPTDMVAVSKIASDYGLTIIEDAAEALGAQAFGQYAGSLGRVACFSLYGNKLITTGEGGMLLTDDPELCAIARWKRDICFGRDDETRFVHQEIGFNYRLTNVQAAIGLAQLEHFSDALAAKRGIAQAYNARLRGLQGLTLPPEAAWAINSFWIYGLVIQDSFGTDRRTLQFSLRTEGIHTRRFFSPVHVQPICPVQRTDDFPRSLELWERGFYLPSYIGLGECEISRITDVIRGFCTKH
jgi:perosamine synthetase